MKNKLLFSSREIPHKKRPEITEWVGFFPSHTVPSPFHPVVFIHACADRMRMKPKSMEDWIGRALREEMGLVDIATMVGRGNPLKAWPEKKDIARNHRVLVKAWKALNGHNVNLVEDDDIV
jgi:hypothetical protein